MECHLATMLEYIADRIPDRTALIHDGARRSWREFDNRASSLAAALLSLRVKPDAKVALLMRNCPEYSESLLAATKIRAVPVNVNYRYLDDELAYLLADADAEIVIHHAEFSGHLHRILPRLPLVRQCIQVGEPPAAASPFVGYEQLISQFRPTGRIRRAGNDLWMVYTGGTTGLPKGVMFDMSVFMSAAMKVGYPTFGLPHLDEVPTVEAALDAAIGGAVFPVAVSASPLMHGAALFLGALAPLLAGGTAVTLTSRSYDPARVLRVAAAEHATLIALVGDVFAIGLVEALDSMPPGTLDLSALRFVYSSGAMFTVEVKRALLDRLANGTQIVDVIGATEGFFGSAITRRGDASTSGSFAPGPATKVFTEDGREVRPGSGEAGVLATSGVNFARGYYKDPQKSAVTFRIINGIQYSVPGDWARVEADGSITLLGRGNQSINTGGEKVFPEEVETVIRRLPDVADCLVVGVPDDRFGQSVAAVIAPAPGVTLSAEGVIAHVKRRLAGYKAPRHVFIVGEVPRMPSGKADYPAATRLANERLAHGRQGAGPHDAGLTWS
jgi:acyl-CoA synthetase (AMP-forming)/AMP-acid ligase II